MSEFKIAGLQYQILEKSPQAMEGKIGMANFNTQEVWINTDHTLQTKKIAVWHEIIHLVSDAYGLDLSEAQVKIGTHALIAFLSENPNFKNIY